MAVARQPAGAGLIISGGAGFFLTPFSPFRRPQPFLLA